GLSWRRQIVTGALHGVSPVQGGRAHPDVHQFRRGHRVGHFGEARHLWSTRSGKGDRLHVFLPLSAYGVWLAHYVRSMAYGSLAYGSLYSLWLAPCGRSMAYSSCHMPYAICYLPLKLGFRLARNALMPAAKSGD